MVRRLLCLLLLLLLVSSFALGDLQWKENTPAQQMLKNYITLVNDFLTEQGEQEINSLFELYERLAVLGITRFPDAETPEEVEITATLTYDSINLLTLRVSDGSRFPGIAAAFLRALMPERITLQQAMEDPADRARKAAKNPTTSFEDVVEELNGVSPRVYYAYYPNQYADGVSWLQMTIVFPLAGAWDGNGILNGATATRGPDTYSGNDREYEGYYSEDDYTHLEIFTTATPEPDSAAGDGGWE